MEIEDRENDQRLKAEDAAKAEAKRVKIEASNLDRRTRSVRADARGGPEYEKLRYIPPTRRRPSCATGWSCSRISTSKRCEAFTELMDDQLERKKNERADWQAVVDGELRQKDVEAREWVTEFETLKKHALRDCDKSEAGVTPELES